MSDPDDATLSSLTVTISNLFDGASEILSADTTGTSITASYGNGVLTLSGSDSLAHYQQVLRSIQYSDTAASPNGTARQIVVVANDGNSNSDPATATVAISSELLLQDVSGSPDTRKIHAGDTFNFNVQYSTSDNDTTLTGLGLRIHYNSQVLTFNGFSYMLPTGFVQQQAPVDDTADFDNDPTTDKYILVSWADVTGNWPNVALPLTLLTPSFTLVSGTATNTSTKINFSASSTAVAHLFLGQSVTVTAVPGDLDISGDGHVTDDVDGVLIMRYMFGFRGDALVSGLAGDLNAAQVTQSLDALNSATPNLLNPDGSASKIADALSDGVIIRRYLRYYQYAETHWKGPDLIQDALIPGDPSPAPAWQDIWTFLDTYMPNLPVPATASPLLAVGPDVAVPTGSTGQARLEAAAAAATNQQIVTPDPVDQTVGAGSPVTIHVNYTTDPQDTSLTGLGLRMHYNSQMLTFDNLSSILGTSFIQQSPPMDDTANFDNDASTDKFILSIVGRPQRQRGPARLQRHCSRPI